MSDVTSDNEIELLTSRNLRENSYEFIRNDLKLIEKKLNSINSAQNHNEDNLLNVLEDCITDSTLSINQLNNKSMIASDCEDKSTDDNCDDNSEDNGPANNGQLINSNEVKYNNKDTNNSHRNSYIGSGNTNRNTGVNKKENSPLRGVMININETVDVSIISDDLVKVLIKSQCHPANAVIHKIESNQFHKIETNQFDKIETNQFDKLRGNALNSRTLEHLHNFNFHLFYLLLILILVFK